MDGQPIKKITRTCSPSFRNSDLNPCYLNVAKDSIGHGLNNPQKYIIKHHFKKNNLKAAVSTTK